MRAFFEEAFESNKARFIEEWTELVSFPSISADPDHADDCTACAEWLTAHLNSIGLNASLTTTSGKPVVYAVREGNPDKPTVLFYGHYDVQPADPLEEWETEPFVLTEKDGRMYGRGAQDNKGQLLYVIKAIEMLLQNDSDLPTIKMVFEGEEECGGESLPNLLPRWGEKLAADVLMVCDTDTVASGAPTIIMGLRGMVGLSITLTGPSYDLHSGVHGGLAPNPAQGIAELVSSLHNPDGSIAVKGFYDGVRPPTAQEYELAHADPFDEAAYEAETGAPPLSGESDKSPVERRGFRPTIDVNGIHSGYGGAGMKTVIASSAGAKLSARLVPDQDPDKCLEALKAHCLANVPAGLKLEIDYSTSVGGAFRLDASSDLVTKVRSLLDTIGDRPTAFMWHGASIPIIFSLAEAAGAEPLLIGFGSEKDRVHAPNESFSIDQFKTGYLYAGLLLTSL